MVLFPDFGPFTVAPDRVERLGNAFTAFINRLLTLEAKAAELSGTSVQVSYRDNVADEGVDAVLVSDIATEWIPKGKSAWQFKAGDLKPGACKAELQGATFAREILQAGGQYRLALGASLTASKVTKRLAALIEEAERLGFDVEPESIQILNADSLATWAESFPALATWPGLGGTGHGTQTFEGWAASNSHTATFIESEERARIQQSIRDALAGDHTMALRITGVSGLGKTRLVMETFRGTGLEPLIVYLKADATPFGVLAHLVTQGRSAVVVVDEFTRDQHKSLAEMIPTGSALRLITIGEPDMQGGLLDPVLVLQRFEPGAMDKLIMSNHPGLGPELRRVIVETADGNIGFAQYLARQVSENPNARTADLVTPEAIRQFIVRSLPTGAGFLACSVLALFSRIGYDGELSSELEMVSGVLGFAVEDLRHAARNLGDAGLLSEQGRYRAVSPHPMAVYLAAAGWREYGDRIVRDLLPKLAPDMSARLFRRAADIGEFEPTRSALVRLLEDDGPFASLEVIERAESSHLLKELAVVAPKEVSGKITEMLSRADEDELRSRVAIRRNLVWTLSKLAWNTFTFDEAADALLRLALAENETWSNNATGTWVELFGLVLPATAAKPPQRLSYLSRAVKSEDARVRLLAVRACKQALSIHESIMISGELQGGVLVEGRGSPATWGEVKTYRRTSLDFLAILATDPDPVVAAAAVNSLVSSIHPILEHEDLRDHLARIFVDLGEPALRNARLELDQLNEMFGRAEEYSIQTEDAHDVEVAPRREGLEAMRRAFPVPTPDEDLWLVSRMHTWDLDGGHLLERVLEVSRRLDDPVASILGLLAKGEAVTAAFDLGKALSRLTTDTGGVEDALTHLVGDDAGAALVGYLWGRVETGVENAFDDFLDEGPGRELDPSVRLALTARGPTTEAAVQRAKALSADRPVAEAVRNPVGLHRGRALAELAPWLAELVPRVSNQEDYNAILDFINLALHRRQGVDAPLGDLWLPILRLRMVYPELGDQVWAWRQLGIRAGNTHPVDTARLVLDLVEADILHLYSSGEGAVLKAAVQSGGPRVWAIVMDAVHAGQWKLQMGLRGWFGDLVDLEALSGWVGDDLDRARAVASVSTIGEQHKLNEVAQFLLSEFPEDQHIESSFYGDLVSGSWSGSESDRISRQISLVEGWKRAHAGVAGVLHFCDLVLASLRSRLSTVLQREAERDWN